MNWTTAADIKAQVQRLWDKGTLLSTIIENNSLFPLRLKFKAPTSTELAESFGAVQEWIEKLTQAQAGHYRIVFRKVRHRIIGENSVPAEIWIDSLDDALAIIGKRREVEDFKLLIMETTQRYPVLLSWLASNPHWGLSLAKDWGKILDIISWLQLHPRPNIYMRQVDIPGVNSKFIENSRNVLCQLLDLALPADAIHYNSSKIQGFCSRYGFLDKAQRVRFRILDENLSVFPGGVDQDIKIRHDAFAALQISFKHVFITENEINFLSFPLLTNSIVIFGAGYGFEMLAEAHWMNKCKIHYWGDIDTHGFAILNQLRITFPCAGSFLMDRLTFLEHQQHWEHEPKPEKRDLARLTVEENALYNEIRSNQLGQQLRLEQEKVGFTWFERNLNILYT